MSRLLASITFALVGLGLAGCKPKAPKTPDAPAQAVQAAAAPAPAPAQESRKAEANPAASFIAQDAFDATKIPVSDAPLPPFPYLNYPTGLNEGLFNTAGTDFDEAYVIVGKKLRKVEGRVESHEFALRNVKMSETEARRNYENLIQAMGGVKVSEGKLTDVLPLDNPAYTELEHKLRLLQSNAAYAAYVVRKPGQLIWIALMTTDSDVKTLVVAEEPLKQTIRFAR